MSVSVLSTSSLSTKKKVRRYKAEAQHERTTKHSKDASEKKINNDDLIVQRIKITD
jgi:hypothetical protein